MPMNLRKRKSNDAACSSPPSPKKPMVSNNTQSSVHLEESREATCYDFPEGLDALTIKDRWCWSPVWRGSDNSTSLPHPSNLQARFHPVCSRGSACIRGSKPLQRDCTHFWEILVPGRLFGSSVRFGVGTNQTRLEAPGEWGGILGEDRHSWAFDYTGHVYHAGNGSRVHPGLTPNKAVTIGVLYEGRKNNGSLTFYIDGQPLEHTFTDLNATPTLLYPFIATTGAQIDMLLTQRFRSASSLQDSSISSIAQRLLASNARCKKAIVRGCSTTARNLVDQLPIPTCMKSMIHFEILSLPSQEPVPAKQLSSSEHKQTESLFSAYLQHISTSAPEIISLAQEILKSQNSTLQI